MRERRAEGPARPSGTELSHLPDIRSTTIKYNMNHLPWPGLKSCKYKQLQICHWRRGAQHTDGPQAAGGTSPPRPQALLSQSSGSLDPNAQTRLFSVSYAHTSDPTSASQHMYPFGFYGGRKWPQLCKNPTQVLGSHLRDLVPGCVNLVFAAGKEQLCPEGGQRSSGHASPLPHLQCLLPLYSVDQIKIIHRLPKG